MLYVFVSSIYDFVTEQRDDYRSETVEHHRRLEFSQYETLRTIELYDNDKFISGNKDSLDREKPFFNIVNFRKNVATRATDLDTKDVQIQSDRTTKTSYAESFLLNLKNRNWMKREPLRSIPEHASAQTRAKYGGVLVKRVESDGKLKLPSRRRGSTCITDQIDIRNGVKIERHYYTPAQLKTDIRRAGRTSTRRSRRRKSHARRRRPIRTAKRTRRPAATSKCGKCTAFCRPASCAARVTSTVRTTAARTSTSVRCTSSCSTRASRSEAQGRHSLGGREDEDPYKYLPYEEVDGRGLGRGVDREPVRSAGLDQRQREEEEGHARTGRQDHLSDDRQNIAAKNVLTEIENGQIVTTAPNTAVTRVNNTPSSLPAFDRLIDEWNTQAERVSSTPPAITGENMPAGQRLPPCAMLNRRPVRSLNTAAKKQDFSFTEIYFDWVLPFLVKQIKKDKDLTATLEPEELKMLAEMSPSTRRTSSPRSRPSGQAGPSAGRGCCEGSSTSERR